MLRPTNVGVVAVLWLLCATSIDAFFQWPTHGAVLLHMPKHVRGGIRARLAAPILRHPAAPPLRRSRPRETVMRRNAAGKDIQAMDRRDAVVPALCAVFGGVLGLVASNFGASRDADSISNLARNDRVVVSDLTVLREQLGLPLRNIAGKGVIAGNGEKGTKGSEAGVREEVSSEVDGTFQLFSIALVGAVLSAQFAWLAKELDKIKAYSSEIENDTQPSWTEVAQYRLDLFLTRNPLAKGLIIVNGAFLVILFGAVLLGMQEHENVGTALWESWTYVADPGTQAQAGAENPALRPVAIAVTLLGLVTFALLVSLVTESVAEQVDSFKRGLSRVLDSGHIVMVGWTDKSISIISQLAFANDSIGGTTIAVLADLQKEAMELELRKAVDSGELNLYNSQVVFRSGDTMLETSLQQVGIQRARAVICLSPKDLRPDEADGNMLRQALSVSGALSAVAEPPPCTIEIQDVDNLNLLRLVNLRSEILVTHDIVGQLMVSCSRQPGLAFLLERTFSFEDSEFYFAPWPELYGAHFKSLTCVFDDAIVLGILDASGTIRLNPLPNTIYQAGDLLLVMAQDDDSYAPSQGDRPCILMASLIVVYSCDIRCNGDDVCRPLRLHLPSALIPLFVTISSDTWYGVSFPDPYQSSPKAQQVRAEMAALYAAQSHMTGGSGFKGKFLAATTTLTRAVNSGSKTAQRLGGLVSRKGPDHDGADVTIESGSGKRDVQGMRFKSQADKTLFIGWRRDMADMIQALDQAVEPGSELWLFSTVPVDDRSDMLLDKGNKRPLKLMNLVVKNAQGNPVQRSNLVMFEALDEFGDKTGEQVLLTAFDSTIILADEAKPDGTERERQEDNRQEGLEVMGAMNSGDHHSLSTDGRSLATFLLVTDVREELLRAQCVEAKKNSVRPEDLDLGTTVQDGRVLDGGRERIITEILDAANTKSLLAQLDCSGYVLSNRIMSDLISQVVEDQKMHTVLDELLSPTGSSFSIRDISEYVHLDREGPLSFWDVALRASDRGQIAVGYKRARDSFLALENRDCEFSLTNPPNKRRERQWKKGDVLVTICRKEHR